MSLLCLISVTVIFSVLEDGIFLLKLLLYHAFHHKWKIILILYGLYNPTRIIEFFSNYIIL